MNLWNSTKYYALRSIFIQLQNKPNLRVQIVTKQQKIFNKALSIPVFLDLGEFQILKLFSS